MSKNLILSGCNGRMGKVIRAMLENDPELKIVAGIDIVCKGDEGFPVYGNAEQITEKADVIVDFSNASALDCILNFALKYQIPLVLSTTGYSQTDIEKIENASKVIPIFFSFNMSLGVNLLISLSKKAAQILGDDFNIEIIEKHHNQKLDAPSGTAIMLANSINSVMDDGMQYEYDRHSKRQKRTKNEIGIHSVRGGTIVGEHDVIFAGNDEVITLSHHAASRNIFASGAIKAAKFICGKPPKIYDMNDMIS